MVFCGKNGEVERDIILVHLALRRRGGGAGKKALRRVEPVRLDAVKDCMNIQYNAIDYAQQLEAAGVPKAQAELHAKALELVVSNCADLHKVKSELFCKIDQAETSLRAEIATIEVKLRAEISAAEERLRGEIHDVESRLGRRIDLIDQKLRFQQWINGLILAMLTGLYVQAYFR